MYLKKTYDGVDRRIVWRVSPNYGMQGSLRVKVKSSREEDKKRNIMTLSVRRMSAECIGEVTGKLRNQTFVTLFSTSNFS